jgi:hypothetical protein
MALQFASSSDPRITTVLFILVSIPKRDNPPRTVLLQTSTQRWPTSYAGGQTLTETDAARTEPASEILFGDGVGGRTGQRIGR